jgi:hypothetical protein
MYRDLAGRWAGQVGQVAVTFPLIVGQSRPYNHPVRRLVVLCHMISSGNFDILWDRLYEVWRARWAGCSTDRDYSKLHKDLLALLPDYVDPYWSHHYLFESSPAAQPLSLIGLEQRQVMFVNVVLPYLLFHLELGRVSAEELLAFDSLYSVCRAPRSGKRNYLVHRFFGDTVKGKLLQRSRYEQGALQIHRDFCVHYEASCEGCPFVDRVRRLLD